MAEKQIAVPAPRLKALYKDTIVKELQAELGLDNVHQVPKLEKIVVSVGTGKKKDDKRHLEIVKNTLEKVTGQAPVTRLAKKSIATFSIRKGMGAPIGVSAALAGPTHLASAQLGKALRTLRLHRAPNLSEKIGAPPFSVTIQAIPKKTPHWRKRNLRAFAVSAAKRSERTPFSTRRAGTASPMLIPALATGAWSIMPSRRWARREV